MRNILIAYLLMSVMASARVSEADLLMAEHLARRGIAILRCEDRGRFFLDFGPAMTLRRVVCPVLTAVGGRDMRLALRALIAVSEGVRQR